MKRFLALALTLLLLCALLAVPVLADEPARLVDDGVGLLNSYELAALEEKALSLRDEGLDAVIYITYDLDDPDSYAENYVDNDGFGALVCDAGVMMLLDTPDGAHGNFYLYGFGKANGIDLDLLSEKAADAFSSYDLSDALSVYLDALSEEFLYYRAISDYETEEEPIEERELPDWYPDDVDSFQEFNDPNAPRMVDSADIFTPAEEAEILAKVREISAKYNRDLVVFTDTNTYGFSRATYAEDFFVFNGYGYGEALDGSVLFISMQPGNRGWYSAFSGTARGPINEETLNWIDDQMEPYMHSGDYADGVMAYLDALDYVYGHGRTPRNVGLPAFFDIVLGLITSGINVSVLKSQMNKVRKATEASTYVQPGSFNLTGSRDIYLYTTRTRTRIASERTGGGGGGGSSGFSSSHSSSSGHSFSGGGRSF